MPSSRPDVSSSPQAMRLTGSVDTATNRRFSNGRHLLHRPLILSHLPIEIRFNIGGPSGAKVLSFYERVRFRRPS